MPVAPVAPAIQKSCRGFLILPPDQELNQQTASAGSIVLDPQLTVFFLVISPGNSPLIRSILGFTINAQNTLPSFCRLLTQIDRYWSSLIQRSSGSHSNHYIHFFRLRQFAHTLAGVYPHNRFLGITEQTSYTCSMIRWLTGSICF